jgi:hypothetical protein
VSVWEKVVYLKPKNLVFPAKFRVEVSLRGFLPSVEMTW